MHNLYAFIVVSASVLFFGALIVLLEWLQRRQPFRNRFPFRKWGLPLALVLVAFLDGTLRHEFPLPGPKAIVLGALNVFVVLYGMWRETIWLSTLETAAIWCAWAFGWTAAHGGVDENLAIGFFSTIGAMSVVMSGFLVAMKKRESQT